MFDPALTCSRQCHIFFFVLFAVFFGEPFLSMSKVFFSEVLGDAFIESMAGESQIT